MAGGDQQVRAARHVALGDVHRLAIVDELVLSDRSPQELRGMLSLESNLIAHHLDVLERAGLISRTKSSGDGRRRYVRLERDALASLSIGRWLDPQPAVLFVCTANSARSQLAAALWRSIAGAPADSAGTRPARTVHPGAVAAATRHGLSLGNTTPKVLASVRRPALVLTVCDQAHEVLGDPDVLHWSIADPVAAGSPRAFDATVEQLSERITQLVTS